MMRASPIDSALVKVLSLTSLPRSIDDRLGGGGEVDDPAAQGGPGVVVDLTAPRDGHRAEEVGRDPAAGAIGSCSVDLAAVGHLHVAEGDEDATAVHAVGLVVADLAGGDENTARPLDGDPAPPEIVRRCVDRGRGAVSADRAAAEDPHGVLGDAPDRMFTPMPPIFRAEFSSTWLPSRTITVPSCRLDSTPGPVGGLVLRHGTADQRDRPGRVDPAPAPRSRRGSTVRFDVGEPQVRGPGDENAAAVGAGDRPAFNGDRGPAAATADGHVGRAGLDLEHPLAGLV